MTGTKSTNEHDREPIDGTEAGGGATTPVNAPEETVDHTAEPHPVTSGGGGEKSV